MRFSVLISAIILAGLFSTTALAQDGGSVRLVSEIDSTSGVPTLTVQEVAVKPQPAKQEPVAAAKKGGAVKTGKTEISIPPVAKQQYSSQPIVMSRVSTGSYTMTDTTGNPDYDKLVFDAGTRNGVDPDLIIAVMRQESGFNYRAHSYKGACGLMQLMPSTARRFGVSKVFDPAQNIEGGARYLRFLLDKFNDDVPLALAGYNAGEGAVVDAGYRIPNYRETRNYVHSISAKYGFASAILKQPPGKPVASPVMETAQGSSSSLSNNY